MVYLPSFGGVNSGIARTAEDITSHVEAYENAIAAVQQVQVDNPFEGMAVKNPFEGMAFEQIQSALQPSSQIAEAEHFYHQLAYPAVDAFQELGRQQQAILETLREVPSAVDLVQQFKPYQWAAIAGLTGITVTTSTPAWMAVSGMAASVTQLPPVTLTELATILAGEAGYAVSIAMDIGIHQLDSVLSDPNRSTIAVYLFAGLLACVIKQGDSWQQNIKQVVFWTNLAVPFIRMLLERVAEK